MIRHMRKDQIIVLVLDAVDVDRDENAKNDKSHRPLWESMPAVQDCHANTPAEGAIWPPVPVSMENKLVAVLERSAW